MPFGYGFSTIMDRDKLARFWVESSDADAKAMRHLFDNGDYAWALFIGHIVIEKLMKAHYAKHHDGSPPFIHDLARIAVLSGLDADPATMDILDTITTFNIRARYDDYKREFASRGTASADSDIDVALVLEGMASGFDTQVELMKLRRGVDLRLEPHPFSSLDGEDPSGFLAEIRLHGIKLA